MTPTVLTVLDIKDYDEIKILEILDIGPGEHENEDMNAEYPCKITWTDTETPEHVLSFSDESLKKTEQIWVLDYSKTNITPGIYIRVKPKAKNLFQKKD